MQSKYHNHSRISVKLLVSVDFLLVLLSLYVFHRQELANIELTLRHYSQILLLVLSYQFILLSLGMYHAKVRETAWGIIRRLLLASTISYMLLSIIHLFMNESIFTKESLFYVCFLSFICCSAFRILLYQFNILGFAKRNVLVLGTGDRAEIIDKRMRRKVDLQSFNLLGFVKMPGDSSEKVSADKIINLTASLREFVINNNVHEIVVANDERRGHLPIDELFFCRIRGIEISEILDFIENETGQIAVNLIYPSWIIYSNGFHSSNDLRNTLDWVFNVLLALTLFVLTWPIMLLTILAIKIEDGISAPCFYLQERVGLGGDVFNIIKFRSMNPDAEKHGIKWAAADDNRTTKVGRFIRKYRIDELPQIFNVLYGDMGFVGPRPERPEFVQQLITKIPYYNERHGVKSGVTGWAQLKYPYGANETDATEKLKYDLYYIKHRSFILDLLILVQTAEIVIFGKGR
ncbi:TIGR03013 family XrtA/PEP-CTERM system glycosyltransferase [Thalassotalea sp. ND16A]|uniref:TIGR03013 family XrtA/PEP-CTERM system glycosyltransferase n=1 Tax=Thalassotalea sp. ND16A TaxID=1535422 RepID=UPI00051DB079|nr:TIGR03013 family XrtA/PEP-CTERM system glycosyltransferase [Thalassotalea sp. ND16A]KGJ95964.1 hypothetical protein ND16A_1143 [Thalassotalea sp. ND16A]